MASFTELILQSASFKLHAAMGSGLDPNLENLGLDLQHLIDSQAEKIPAKPRGLKFYLNGQLLGKLLVETVENS